MKFAWCRGCHTLRAVVPARTGSMLRTHYVGGSARHRGRLLSSKAKNPMDPSLRCPGSRTLTEPTHTLTAKAAAG